MSDRIRVVTHARVDMRPTGATPPAPPEPYRVVADALVGMRELTEPLDYLPQPRLALWTRRLSNTYAGSSFRAWGSLVAEEVGFVGYRGDGRAGDLNRDFLARYDSGEARVDVGRDQGGLGHDLGRGATDGPRAAHEGAAECEGPTPVWRFFPDGTSALRRADALGLAGDPALTVAWKMRGSREPDTLPRALLALGTAAAPELILAAQNQLSSGDRVLLAGPAPGLARGASWQLPEGTLLGWHSYVLTEPTATGYAASEWRLRVDGVDLGPPSFALGALALGGTLTELGSAPGLDSADCQLAGLVLWDSVLDAAQLARLQGFLDGQLPGSSFSPALEPFALGEDGVFWTLDGAYLQAA